MSGLWNNQELSLFDKLAQLQHRPPSDQEIDQAWVDVEQNLYAALEGFEQRDLIAIRQGADRARSGVVWLWRAQCGGEKKPKQSECYFEVDE